MTRNVLWSRASVSVCVCVCVCPWPHAYTIAQTRMGTHVDSGY